MADAIQQWGKGDLHVLPAGQVPPKPSELLGSRSMASLLEQPASRYDRVLIDTPPLEWNAAPRHARDLPATFNQAQTASARHM